MFKGTSAITLDSKNRITMPTRYREELLADCQGQLVCTVDIQNPCLALYPIDEWEEIEIKLAGLSSMQPANKMLQQVILGHATECQMDKAGRLLLSGPLREYANLSKNVRLVGSLKKFEIWQEDAWLAHIQQGISKIQSGEIELTEQALELSL
ncbi:division/cell wall cluster transcriptional repressor MraZ [Endozoicomonas sp. G2_1]|uniref:division/cell wall cluster transcriptional repressor MraZ n=1 Tax=Endozoicomonas sp. G2_1 TaxID=2821091 RepID=UPI001ADB13E0|nr:division/cell wall cluster transcriptional repressor MraZ [Endozoicomonas sp. G2_1]MBO9491074.1 division/cell wall cluster transcriptional repressor MraZ [Endozoicomonas sp. G2_1]